MEKPTESQLKVIGYIESNTGITYAGSTKKSAQTFISENMENSKGSKMITDKQKSAIDNCCQLLGVVFHGASKGEARLFLMEHIEKARAEVLKRIKEERRAYMNPHHTTFSPNFMPSRVTTAFAYGVFGIPLSPSDTYGFEEICLNLEEDIEECGEVSFDGSRVFVPYR